VASADKGLRQPLVSRRGHLTSRQRRDINPHNAPKASPSPRPARIAADHYNTGPTSESAYEQDVTNTLIRELATGKLAADLDADVVVGHGLGANVAIEMGL
jgi:hypothetical protein